MIVQKFITNIWQDRFELTQDVIKELDDWIDFEKELDPIGRNESTTEKGWQYSFGPKDKMPRWLEILQPNIKNIKEEIKSNYIKSSWVVDYNTGGYQDPHFHEPGNDLKTVILNLRGEGELLLFDPRPMAVSHGESIVEKVKLTPGDWIAIPSWLVHNTKPCNDRRTIYVMDVYS